MPIRNEISIIKGLVLKGTRITVPSSLRKEGLQKIHTGHLGMEKCIARRTREILYWPIINSYIKQMIGECQHCTQYRKQLPAETIQRKLVSEVVGYVI